MASAANTNLVDRIPKCEVSLTRCSFGNSNCKDSGVSSNSDQTSEDKENMFQGNPNGQGAETVERYQTSNRDKSRKNSSKKENRCETPDEDVCLGDSGQDVDCIPEWGDEDAECDTEFGVITKSMWEEEEKLNEENVPRDDQDESSEMSACVNVEEKFQRLTSLLERSKIYADFLLKIVETKKEEERKKALKKEKMKKKKYEDNNKNKNERIKESSGQITKKRPHDQMDRSDGQRPKKTKRAAVVQSFEGILEKNLYLPSEHDALVNGMVEADGDRFFRGQIVNPVQPRLFTGGILRDYQIVGYQWMKVLFLNAVNGILADEMGLGKTIQCIALICKLVRMGFKGPFLVCAPLSTIPNWLSEFKKFAPEIPLLLYHGSKDERVCLAGYIKSFSDRVKCHPIVITSFEILINDRPILARHNWDYLILDEGHRIKNKDCRLGMELKKLHVGAKLLLTGTPLQNNLAELWSLLNFIVPELFDDLQVFESWFDTTDIHKGGNADFSLEQEEKFVSALHEILSPFVLRRVKSDVILDLPPKSEVIVYAPFSPKQESFYRAAIDKTLRQLVTGEDLPASTVHTCVSNDSHVTRSTTADARLSLQRAEWEAEDKDVHISLNNVLMLLRKCCNHPYLIEYPLVPGTEYFKVDEEIVRASGKLTILDRMLPKLRERGHKVLLFSQMTEMLDIMQDYLQLRKYISLRLDGSTKIAERHELIEKYNSDSDVFIFLLSTRAGGLGINLVAADTVIIYDSDWNPQNDLQAQDRCHRIGQTRPVMVYRLVTSSSIDQQMVEAAARKRSLEKVIMHERKFKGQLEVELKQRTKIGRGELLRMLKTPDYDHVVHGNAGAMSEEQLESLLDRSDLMKKMK